MNVIKNKLDNIGPFSATSDTPVGFLLINFYPQFQSQDGFHACMFSHLRAIDYAFCSRGGMPSEFVAFQASNLFKQYTQFSLNFFVQRTT